MCECGCVGKKMCGIKDVIFVSGLQFDKITSKTNEF